MKIEELLELYRLSNYRDAPDERHKHVDWMLDQMKDMLRERTVSQLVMDGKFNRWLGFVQGFLWTSGIYSVDQLREQVRNLEW